MDRLKDPGERIKLAEDPSTPIDVLEQISHGMTRGRVARNPSASSETLERLSNDFNGVVRYYVAMNPSTPFETLIRLTSDEDHHVRNRAWESIEERGLIALLGDG